MHNFIYTTKVLFRNKTLIFWTLLFPIIMATLFHMAFSNIDNNLDKIKVSIVNNNEFNNNMIFKESLKELSRKYLNITYTTKEESNKLLNNNKIIGYLYIENNKKTLVFKNNGIEETIFKYLIETINDSNSIIESNLYIDTTLLNNKPNIKDISSNKLNYILIEFYSLIAMTALYGGLLSMNVINNNLPNITSIGKRISIAPISKGKIIITSILSSLIVQILSLLLLFIYTIFILKIDYSGNIYLIILLSTVATIAGLSLGLVISTINKIPNNSKIGLLLGITMLYSYLSGMMGITTKYVIDKNIPIINKINPASMITDGFYSLYISNYNRYIFDIVSLIIFSLILILISTKKLRRLTYDSI